MVKQRIEKSDDKYILTKVNFAKILKTKEKSSYASSIFEKFDRTNLGYIDTYEFLCFIILVSNTTFDQKATMLFELYDTDKSLTLSMEESEILMQNAFAAMSVLEEKPKPSQNHVKQSLQSFFKDADLNHDEKISLLEFKTYIRTEKTILQAITSSGLSQSQEIGKDFSSGQNPETKGTKGEVMWIPMYDDDLEAECKPAALSREQAKMDRREAVLNVSVGEFEEEAADAGDQFLCSRQKFVAPDNYKPPKRGTKAQAPQQQLQLEYVYGYRCHDNRNNVRLTAGGEVVYHAAALGIVLDPLTNTQRFFESHRDDIHGFDINPEGTLAVSGEIGPKPRLCLWSTETMECIDETRQPLVKGIKHVAWSKDGKLVGCSDMSDDHNIAIFQLSANQKKLVLIAKGKGVKADIMSLGFSPLGDTLVATCVKQVKFFWWSNRSIKASNGTGWGKQPADTILSQAYVGNKLFTGNYGGELIEWSGTQITNRQKAHKAKVNALWAVEETQQLLSGSNDGFVKIWDASGSLSIVKNIDLRVPLQGQSLPINPQVQSIFYKDQQMLIGTRGGEIVSIQGQDTQVLMRSHSNNELWGLAVHPREKTMTTWDRAGQLCVWDIEARVMKQSCVLQTGGDSLAYSTLGKYLAVGQLNGTLLVLHAASFDQYAERKDRKGKSIQVIRFSPDDKLCAVGGHDSTVLVYDVVDQFKPLSKFSKFSSTVKFIDWKLDSQAFQALSQAYELLYYDIMAKQQNTRGTSEYKNEKWASWTSTLGWPVQGIWPPGFDGSDINSCDRAIDHSVIVTGDDFGVVSLYEYPAASSNNAPHNKYYGHSSHVTSVQFTRWAPSEQPYLISTGGEDKCVFQFKYHKSGQMKKQVSIITPKSAGQHTINIMKQGMEKRAKHQQSILKQKTNDISSLTESAILQEESKNEVSSIFKTKRPEEDEEDDEETEEESVTEQEEAGEFDEESEDEGDQVLAVKPWISAVKHMKPSTAPKDNFKVAPQAHMQLKWAHGFRSFDTTNNLFYNENNEAVYCTAGVGVVHDFKSQAQTQKFFNQHKEDIVALAVHNNQIVATGQMAGKDVQKQARGRKKPSEGKLVNIFIWDAKTGEQIGAPINGLHRRAVRQLAFSKDGKWLLSIGEDDKRTLGVYSVEEIQQGKKCERILAGSCITDPCTINDAVWSDNGQLIGIVSVKNVLQVVVSGDNQQLNLKKTILGANKRKTGGNKKDIDFHSSVTFLNNKMVTGTSKGVLHVWTGSSSKEHAAHSGQIYCMKSINGELYTSGQDGIIYSWTAAMQKNVVIDLNQPDFNLSHYPTLGITAFDKAESTILLGTKSSTVLEVTTGKKQSHTIVNQGHFKHPKMSTYSEVWGCATHPQNDNIYVSAGGDKFIRMWQYDKEGAPKQILESVELGDDVTALDWSACGKWIACGDREAKLTIIDSETLGRKVSNAISSKMSAAQAAKMRGRNNFKSQQWIEVCRFSPDNNYVAYGHHGYDTDLELIRIDPETGEIISGKKSARAQHASAVNHIDWSQDSQTILCTNTGYEIRAFTVSDDKLIHNGSLSGLKDTQWQTWSLNLGWPVQGIYGSVIDFTEINCLERSHTGTIIATGWDTGEVKFHNYPNQNPKAKSDSYYGHSSHLTKVKFSAKDDFLISTGGNDMTVFLWDTDLVDQEQFDSKYDEDGEDDVREYKHDQSKAAKKTHAESIAAKKAKAERGDNHDDEPQEQKVRTYFEEEDPGCGDEFLAVKPWKGQMKPPQSAPKRPSKRDTEPPEVELELEWVHGYRGYDSRNNMQVMANGSLAYYVAGVVCSYDPVNHAQKHFIKHSDDVTSIAFSPDKKYICTGELGKKPVAYVTDFATMTQVAELKGNGIKESISAVTYSGSGKLLAVVAGDQDHNIAIYNTGDWSLLASGKGDRMHVRDIEFNPSDDNEFVIVGTKLFKKFTISGAKFRGKLGQFGTSINPKLTCGIYNGQAVLTGNTDGDLLSWSGLQPKNIKPKLHSKRLDAILVTQDYVLTGGKDMQIFVLNKSYETLTSINLESLYQNGSSVSPQVRALSLNEAEDALYVGTFGSEFIEIKLSLAGKTNEEPRVLTHGHYAPGEPTNEVWGLCTYGEGDNEKFATVSDDATVRIWNAKTHKQIAYLPLDKDAEAYPYETQGKNTKLKNAVNRLAKGRSIDISFNNHWMAVGTFGGLLRVFEEQDAAPFWKEIATPEIKAQIGRVKHEMEWIQDLKFSRDDKYLAVSSHNDRVFLFETEDFKKHVKVIGMSSSFITQLDWALDCKHFRTVDSSYEILYYSVEQQKNIPGGASQFRDEHWQTCNGTLGWAVQGVWKAGFDGSDINRIDRSHDETLVATADDKGHVSVYRYPSPVDSPAGHVLATGHSSHVTNVKFNKDSTYLYSTGGNDTAVMQWKVTQGQQNQAQVVQAGASTTSRGRKR